MSDIILRGLALDSSKTVTTLPSNLRGLVKNTTNETYNQGATTLSRLDYLITSNNTKKGTAPVSLLDPNNLKTNNNQQSKVTKQELLQGLNDVTNTNRNTSNNITTNTQVFVSTTYNFIDTDYTSEKLELAIEAIDNWERKVNTLNSLVTNASGQVGVAYKNSIISNADKLNKARQEAIIARQEAIIAYQNALKEMMEIGNYSSSKSSLYRQKYNIMETKFQQVKQEDQTTMDKVKKFLKEGFNILLDYANPFNY
ncbi:MAG: hypothetical protein KatS3mg068_0978 [Candidatus Sericytochromatia bacterium]|nr:MAG: hypothetical protein KatS3mg068_0978 [Candidatus Sericytochromatia bacterium]